MEQNASLRGLLIDQSSLQCGCGLKAKRIVQDYHHGIEVAALSGVLIVEVDSRDGSTELGQLLSIAHLHSSTWERSFILATWDDYGGGGYEISCYELQHSAVAIGVHSTSRVRRDPRSASHLYFSGWIGCSAESVTLRESTSSPRPTLEGRHSGTDIKEEQVVLAIPSLSVTGP